MLPLIDSFQDAAKHCHDRMAIQDEKNTIHYGPLAEQVNQVAQWFIGSGLNKGDRVGIHLQNSIEYIILYYACWRARLVPVALNTYASKKEIDFWLIDSSCKLLFSNRYSGSVDNLAIHEVEYINDQLTINRRTLSELAAATDYQSPRLDDVATIIYTSGTTGNPKGITLIHSNLAANIASVIQSLKITSEDKFLCVLPFFYSFGNSILHTHLACGATLVLLNHVMYPVEVLKTLQREHCNGFAGVPSLYMSLLKKTRIDKYELSKLRYMTQAGGPLSKTFIRKIHSLLPHVDFVIMYGQTEATARISFLPPDFLVSKIGSVGIAVDGVEISIEDKKGRQCNIDEIGEICVQGENVMSGYWNNPEATDTVIKNDRLHTGDMGYKDGDGFLYIVGRQSEILKISEHRVSPYEIEEVLLTHKAVEECAVVGCSHEQMGQFARAYIVKNSRPVDEIQLKKYCKQSLATYKIPKEILFVGSLPKTSSGKIKRSQLAG